MLCTWGIFGGEIWSLDVENCNPLRAVRWSFATWFYDFLSSAVTFLLYFSPPIFFLSSLYTFSHFKHSLLRQVPNPPTFHLLFTPLNSYSVCSIILRTLRTFRSLVSYSWNNVLTAGYTVCISLPRLCMFNLHLYANTGPPPLLSLPLPAPPPAIQSNSRRGAITIIKLVYLNLTIKSHVCTHVRTRFN